MAITNSFLKRYFVASACASFLVIGACTSFESNTYMPQRGQSGKDVVWIATQDALVVKMLNAARVTDKDLVYDLGAGDGIIPITASKQFGARAIGIEYNPRLVKLAQDNALRSGVADKVKIIQGDIFVEDFSQASVVTLYLLEELNARLRPLILKMPPGTRVVSNTFSMGDWEPDQVIDANGQTAYLWTVPAQVGGSWIVSGINSDWKSNTSHIHFVQRHQRLSGKMTVGGKDKVLFGARIEGNVLHFSFLDPQDELKHVKASIVNNQWIGEVVSPYGMVEFKLPVQKITAVRSVNNQ
ncbi:MAG: methyltransferase domain-containing protein [Betaproteobacteria bacterium]|nr:methyltransferase domain-containing protein [Betaproteobacteria bacterium]